MNIRQGVKRIYILFASVCVIATGAGTATLVPSASSEMSDHVYKIKNSIADSLGIESWKLPEYGHTNEEFILNFCNGNLEITYKDPSKNTFIKPNEKICQKISNDNESLTKRQVEAVAMSFAYMALAAAIATAMFFIARWVINGFTDKK